LLPLFALFLIFPAFSQSLTVETIMPNWGPPAGGTDFTIKGTNFRSGAVVYINEIECTTTFVNSETLQATSPDMGSHGVYPVKVENTDDGSIFIRDWGFNAIETIYYISEVNGDDANNGTDPSTPKLNIQKLIDETIGRNNNPPDGPIEIRLEQGTYKENLWLKKRVVLAGGWSSGFTEREPDLYITVLDGDYDDLCARSWGTGATITVDGVTMMNGRRIGGGGGFKSFDDYTTLTNNIIVNNRCETNGGGIFLLFNNDADNSIVSDNIIIGNRTDYHNGGGAAITSYDTYLWDLIPDVVITSNFIVGNITNKGGGVWIYPEFNESERFQIKHNIIARNEAEFGTGGGILFLDDATINMFADLKNNLIRDNKAATYGGGLLIDGSGEGIFALRQQTIAGNEATWFGDGLTVHDSNLGTVEAKDSILYFNNGDDVYDGPGTTAITHSDIEEGFSGAGNISDDPLFMSGPLGDFYLSQTDAGDPSNSPCLNRGSNLAQEYAMDSLTTRTDEIYDSGLVDLGHHYRVAGFPSAPADPVIDSILPSAGNFRGGDWVVIRGHDFRPDAKVFFKGNESLDVIIITSKKLIAEVPPSDNELRESVTVTVHNPDDSSYGVLNGYQYVDAVAPTWDSTMGIESATDAADCNPGVILKWNRATDNDSPPVTYNLYRTTLNPWDDTPFIPTKNEYPSDPDSYRPATYLNNVPELTYLDSDVSKGTNYWYIVEAVDSSDAFGEVPNRELNGVISLAVMPSTDNGDTTAPAPVGNTLMAEIKSSDPLEIHLDWMASEGAFKYNIYKGTDASTLDDPANLLHTTDYGYMSEYDDSDPVDDLIFYKVKATDSCSPPGNEADE
jgi:hypothetical protein